MKLALSTLNYGDREEGYYWFDGRSEVHFYADMDQPTGTYGLKSLDSPPFKHWFSRGSSIPDKTEVDLLIYLSIYNVNLFHNNLFFLSTPSTLES